MSRYSYKQECLRNSENISKFYSLVLHNFIEKLYKEYRYKKVIEEEDITLFEKRIKQKLRDKVVEPAAYFNNYVGKKQSTRLVLQLSGQTKSKVKEEDLMKTEQKHDNITEKSKSQVVSNQSPEDDEQEYVDDLEGFYDQQFKAKLQSQPKTASKSSISEQEASISELKLKVQSKKIQENDSSDESKGEQNINMKIEQRIGTALLGSFSSFNIKRKPKQQKIFLQLQNVFIKNVNNFNEQFYCKLNCELTKIEKNDIKEIRELKSDRK